MPLINLYYALYSKFTKMGITLADLFEEYKPEKTDNIDLGLRFRKGVVELLPTAHISRHKNLWTPITPGWMDPDNPTQPLLYQGKPVSYSTFVGKAKGYGFELGSNFILSDNITLFFNPSYTILTYDGDIVSGGTTYNTDGKQVLDVPRFSLVSGLIIKYQGFQFTPILRHMGKRFGDLAYKEKMPSYSVMDLKFGYNLGNFYFLKDLELSLEVDNVFNREYVVSTSYYPGAPFSVFGTLTFKF
jgi:iron complex outermembrane receptor protein